MHADLQESQLTGFFVLDHGTFSVCLVSSTTVCAYAARKVDIKPARINAVTP
jgi:hypothetical protein